MIYDGCFMINQECPETTQGDRKKSPRMDLGVPAGSKKLKENTARSFSERCVRDKNALHLRIVHNPAAFPFCMCGYSTLWGTPGEKQDGRTDFTELFNHLFLLDNHSLSHGKTGIVLAI